MKDYGYLTYLGHHTEQVKRGLTIGFALFIISEIMAFLSVFWAYFHSSLAPAVEIGGVWPPLGISVLDAFAIPLLNTVLLLSSGAFITFAHHAVIKGNRRSAILGLILTLVFAIIFTGLQYYEYSEAGFTIADSIYGTLFFASTGLHGLLTIVPTKWIKLSICRVKKYQLQNLRVRTIQTPPKRLLNLEPSFLEWLSGLTDAEGNFNISLRNLNNGKYNSVIITYQIGLHIDDLKTLKFIKANLGCGHISISGSKCNFFVNDQFSLIHVILPLFNHTKLNSSKYYKFLIFEKAINLIKNKEHLTSEGKLKMIEYYHEIKKSSNLNAPSLIVVTDSTDSTDSKLSLNKELVIRDNTSLTDNWIGGFFDGDGCFSASNSVPRFIFENHIKELELFKRIKEYFVSKNCTGTLKVIPPSLKNNSNKSSPSVSFEIDTIHELQNVVVPLFSNQNLLQSKKRKDFDSWSVLVNIYYLGYHLLPEGKHLISEIQKSLNKFRFSSWGSVDPSNLTKKVPDAEGSLLVKLQNLYLLPATYEIKKGVRYKRGTNSLVAEKLQIITIDNLNNKTFYSSLSECSKALQIERSKIKKCLTTGEKYKNIQFIIKDR